MTKSNSHENATQLDESNNNTKWQDAIVAELDQQMEYETCKYLSHKSKAKHLLGFKNIMVNFVHYFKYDGCHNSMLAANIHLTDTPLSNTRS